MEYINLPDGTLAPVSPYCHAVRAGDLLFVTGQLAQEPTTNEIQRGAIEDQTRRVMDNLKLVLEAGGSSFDQVVMARVFVTDMRFLPILNPIYASYFSSGHIPGRTAIGVTGLAGLGDLEIDLIAYCGGSGDSGDNGGSKNSGDKA
ncbi:MAG: RidA family protein [Pegethrix bostrychoides GSE-TBD4-15B]|jgi:2-iminobutanoate/2-iminopropanoate deaminase|uniref:RidA family protein n=1 Tax=Pegethrix bostrychoides GSE-TBD4-15B TaxID=2839662 RepID=A0A951U5X7_9CYAN|nr:RidA family protein [Pegethrix bostrychoides GSE-TBD4-15B]